MSLDIRHGVEAFVGAAVFTARSRTRRRPRSGFLMMKEVSCFCQVMFGAWTAASRSFPGKPASWSPSVWLKDSHWLLCRLVHKLGMKPSLPAKIL